MKLYDFGASAAALLFTFGIVLDQGNHTPAPTLADCETVAITNAAGDVLYYNLADATCGSAFVEGDGDSAREGLSALEQDMLENPEKTY